MGMESLFTDTFRDGVVRVLYLQLFSCPQPYGPHFIIAWLETTRYFFHDWDRLVLILALRLQIVSSRNSQLNNSNSLMAGIRPNPGSIHRVLYIPLPMNFSLFSQSRGETIYLLREAAASAVNLRADGASSFGMYSSTNYHIDQYLDESSNWRCLLTCRHGAEANSWFSKSLIMSSLVLTV
jgi:hypothetical protein